MVTGVVPAPPRYVPSFLVASRIGFSIPTVGRFSSNVANSRYLLPCTRYTPSGAKHALTAECNTTFSATICTSFKVKTSKKAANKRTPSFLRLRPFIPPPLKAHHQSHLDDRRVKTLKPVGVGDRPVSCQTVQHVERQHSRKHDQHYLGAAKKRARGVGVTFSFYPFR